MTGTTDLERRLIGWSVSILLHIGLLILGATWLIQSPRFHVEAGKTSTEIDLVIEPASVPVATPPVPTPPPASIPAPPLQPVPAPEPVKPKITPAPEAVAVPPRLPTLVPAKPQGPKIPARPKTSPAKETSSAASGAVQAQPDELHNEPPDYPEESRIAGEQGVVILKVEVTAEGKPVSVSILKSSGYFRLDQAARRAVQHWKFQPAMTAGIPVASEADVPVHFKLQ